MKKYILPLLLLPAIAWGQARFGHLDAIELEKMYGSQLNTPSRSDSETVTLLMRVADDATVDRVESAGATVDQREGNILVVTVPLDKAEAIAATEGVVTVSLPKELTFHEWTSEWGPDLSRTSLGLDRIQSASSPLPQAYTGKGVVIGAIDVGLDPQHINFINSDGTHRVKRIWYSVMNGRQVFTQTVDTEEKVAKFKTDDYSQTHGTHMLGIAAGGFVDPTGNGPDLRGAAPEADIALAAGVATNAVLLKDLRNIVDYAKSEGKPCVINLSLGSNAGPHDGTDEFPAGLNEIASEEGVVVCVSAGNEGDGPIFMRHEFDSNATPLRTIINPTEYTASLWSGIALFPQAIGTMEIWSEDSTPFDIYFDVVKFGGATPEVTGTFLMPRDGSMYTASAGMAPSVKVDSVDYDNSAFNAVYRGFIGGATEVYAANNRYHADINLQLECSDAAAYQTYRVAMRIEGQPGKKVYIYGQTMSSVYPYQLIGGFEGYTAADGNGSINAMAGADKVITVGSCVTHNMGVANDVLGTTAYYSSWGHTPDGRLHPMVTTPGTRIISSMSGDYVEGDAYDANQISYYSYTDSNGETFHWTPMSGTSMSSPFMAGIAATWLSADPTLTVDDIVSIARETAGSPSQPSVNDGSGVVVNAFEGLCRILNLSGIDNVAVRETPYSISRDGNVLTIGSPATQNLSATVYTLTGSTAATATTAGQQLTIDCSALTPGIYVVSVNTDGSHGSEKIVIK